MRPLHDEHHGTKACNDADSCPAVRTRVRGIYLPAPLHAQAGTEVQTGLSSRLSSHLMGALHRDAMEELAHTTRRPRQAGYPLYDHLQSLCQMEIGRASCRERV